MQDVPCIKIPVITRLVRLAILNELVLSTIYRFRPVGAGHGGSKKINNESKDSERSQKWLIRNPRLWRSPPQSSRLWVDALRIIKCQVPAVALIISVTVGH